MTVIVLAMHGSPPKDYPSADLREFFKFHMIHEVGGEFPRAMHHKYDILHSKMRDWPRLVTNDPIWDASNKLAEELSKITERQVIVGFNEFCGPSIDEALEKAALTGEDEILVITPMMTPSGEHSEIDIPESIEKARERHSSVSFRYAWPFDVTVVASFLAEQLSHH